VIVPAARSDSPVSLTDRRWAGRKRHPVRRGRVPRSTVLLIGVAVLIQVACGKKGPPEAPFVRVPAPMTDLRVQRIGDDVVIGFTLPIRNQDGTQPADLERVDIYAMTVQPHLPADRTLDLEDFQEDATLVTTIEVAPPPEPSGSEEPAEPSETSEEPPPVDLRPLQGFPVTFSETIAAALLVPVDPWEEERRRREREEAEEKEDAGPQKPVKVPLMTPPLPGPLERRYAVVGVSSDGNESEPALRIAVPLVTPPFAPSELVVTYDEEVATVAWALPVGVRRAVQMTTTPGLGPLAGAPPSPLADPAQAVPPPLVPPPSVVPGVGGADTAAPTVPADGADTAAPTVPGVDGADTAAPVAPGVDGADTPALTVPGVGGAVPAVPLLPPLASTSIVEWPPASRYELFEIVDPGDGPTVMPQPLNPLPLTEPTYVDKRVEFGVEHCYAVVTLDVVSGLEVRSPLSPPTCVTFLDTFAPTAPTGLNAVGTAGAVSLSWQPNEEDDLVGYMVLRGVAPGETLLPLTVEPVGESTYLDGTAVPGVAYVYAVQAVDDAEPANLSPASETVNATAR
jgi:hypothetical protein